MKKAWNKFMLQPLWARTIVWCTVVWIILLPASTSPTAGEPGSGGVSGAGIGLFVICFFGVLGYLLRVLYEEQVKKRCRDDQSRTGVQRTLESVVPTSSYCSNCGARLAEDVRFCAQCGGSVGANETMSSQPQLATTPTKSKSHIPLIGCGCLTLLVTFIMTPVFLRAMKNANEVTNEQTKVTVTMDKNKIDAQDPIAESKTSKITEADEFLPKLEVQSWRWENAYGTYAQIVGEVKNISSESLDGVDAVASFYDNNGEIVTSDDALIDFQPILSGQTSTFKVTVRFNPAMESARVVFKRFNGGTIEAKFKDSKKK